MQDDRRNQNVPEAGDGIGPRMNDHNIRHQLHHIIPIEEEDDDKKCAVPNFCEPCEESTTDDDDVDAGTYHDSIVSFADAACLTLSCASSVIEHESEKIRMRLYPTAPAKRAGDDNDATRSSKRLKQELSSSSEQEENQGHSEQDESTEKNRRCDEQTTKLDRASAASIVRQINRMKRMTHFLQKIDFYQMKLMEEIQACCRDENENIYDDLSDDIDCANTI